MISGKPVTASMDVTLMPAALSAVAVPPVEMISTPAATSAWTKGISPSCR
jgi:hypothetical protein